MRPVTLNTFGLLNTICSHHVPPFPTILALQNIWVYVGSTNCGNKAFYIEASVDYFLGVGPILSVPNINPDYGHIRLG